MSVTLALALVAAGQGIASGGSQQSQLYIPPSSIEHPGDRGVRVHTNWVQLRRNAWADPVPHGPVALFALPGPDGGLTPQNVRAAYAVSGNGKGVIAIVDAFDNPNALGDFNTFAAYYGLPTEPSSDATAGSNKVFQVVYAAGTRPATDSSGGWEFEEALDIEWAHAMAPGAKIVLVESSGNDWDPMMAAVDVAVGMNANQISMSWLGGEFSGETAYDVHFSRRSGGFFAASGDGGAGVGYPSASPLVTSCGATALNLNASGGYGSETGWSGSGGGSSSQEPIPAWQAGLTSYNAAGATTPVTGRATPDISAVGDPATGVSLYSSFGGGGWTNVGGTSVSAPVLAGITNSATVLIDVPLYARIYLMKHGFHDITVGNNGYPAGKGYDYVTGMGTPVTMHSL